MDNWEVGTCPLSFCGAMPDASLGIGVSSDLHVFLCASSRTIWSAALEVWRQLGPSHGDPPINDYDLTFCWPSLRRQPHARLLMLWHSSVIYYLHYA